MSLPYKILSTFIARNGAREALAEAEAKVQEALKPHAGETFELEGVPFKVCKGPSGLYLRRMVGAAEASILRAKWRSE